MELSKDYLSMSEAAKLCPYEQDYLSLLARRGELRAEKIGRKWYTKIQWLNAYIAKKKPGDLIVTQEMQSKLNAEQKKQRLFSILLAGMVGISLLVIIGFYFYSSFSRGMADSQKKSLDAQFTPTEIVKVPNEDGNFDVYGIGKMKLGTEKVGQ